MRPSSFIQAVSALALLLAATLSASAIAASPNTGFNVRGILRFPGNGGVTATADARILLNGGQFVGLVRRDRTFVVYDVPEGVHLLEVSMMGFSFDPVRLEVSSKDGQGRIKATAHGQKLGYPLSLAAAPVEYFEEYQPIDVLGMLKNPMVLMLLFTVIMVVVMPRMMSNMSPAELEEMREQQKKFGMADIMKQAQALRA